ncbi:MAG: hypothetical protein ACLTEH_03025, partial [Clostridia bacterium]
EEQVAIRKEQQEIREEQVAIRKEQQEIREEQVVIREEQQGIKEEQVVIRKEQQEIREEQTKIKQEQIQIKNAFEILNEKVDGIASDVNMLLEEQKDTNVVIQIMMQQMDKMLLSHT